MRKSLTTRLDQLEAQHTGPRMIVVTYDDETYTSNGQTYTHAQVDAMPDKVILRVVYESAEVKS